jgi:hypothetical protein
MYLTTGDFENGYGPWRPVNFAQAVTPTTVQNPARAKQGKAFMQFRTTQPGGSMAHDVVVQYAVIDAHGVRFLAHALQFSVWLRSAAGRPNVQGAVAIWDLIYPARIPPKTSSTAFNVGGQWTQVSVGFDLGLADPVSGPGTYTPNIRVEIYLQTINQDLDVDAAVLI